MNGECLGKSTYAVLRISGCTLYSLAKTKGTIPCGRAACFQILQSKDILEMALSIKTNNNLNLLMKANLINI